MKLPSFRRIYSGDFDSQYKGLLDKLSGTINTGIEAIYQVLNNNVSLGDNIACTVANVTLTVDANGNPLGSASFKLNNTLQVIGVIVIMCQNTKNTSTPPPGGVFVSFTTNSVTSANTNNLVLTNVTGLTAGVQYTLTLVALN